MALVIVIGEALGVSACVLPEDLHAPQEHAPHLLAALSTPEPGIVFSVARSAAGSPQSRQTFTTVVVDADDQVLLARAFVDGRYDRALALNNDRIPPAPPAITDGRRTHLFDIDGLCDAPVNNVLGRHVLEFYVSDNGFVGRGSDLRVPNPGGLRDSLLWVFNCVEPLPPSVEAGGAP